MKAKMSMTMVWITASGRYFLCSNAQGNKQLKGDVPIGWHIPFFDVSKAWVVVSHGCKSSVSSDSVPNIVSKQE